MDTTFETFVAREVFSELFGFVLLNPDTLDARYAEGATGRDLLHEYTTSDEGDRVAADGVAVPMLGLPADDYTLVVRHVDAPSLLIRVTVESPGWVLSASARPLCLCGLGYLSEWNAEHPRVMRPAVPEGWYAVTIRGGTDVDDHRALELVLTPSAERPPYTGDTNEVLELEPFIG
ncbi:MAG: hypothetical protein R3B99_15120 [Polyangiales bacterium]